MWDYPRPPRVDVEPRKIEVRFGGVVIASASSVVIVRETAGAPVFFLSRDDIAPGALRDAGGGSVCEWKGRASYFDVTAGGRVAERAAFTYESPTPRFEAIAGRIALYAAPMDEVLVDGERARPQPGSFYAGWVLPWVRGPIKGAPGTLGW